MLGRWIFAIAVASPLVWNSLPYYLRAAAYNIDSFGRFCLYGIRAFSAFGVYCGDKVKGKVSILLSGVQAGYSSRPLSSGSQSLWRIAGATSDQTCRAVQHPLTGNHFRSRWRIGGWVGLVAYRDGLPANIHGFQYQRGLSVEMWNLLRWRKQSRYQYKPNRQLRCSLEIDIIILHYIYTDVCCQRGAADSRNTAHMAIPPSPLMANGCCATNYGNVTGMTVRQRSFMDASEHVYSVLVSAFNNTRINNAHVVEWS